MCNNYDNNFTKFFEWYVFGFHIYVETLIHFQSYNNVMNILSYVNVVDYTYRSKILFNCIYYMNYIINKYYSILLTMSIQFVYEWWRFGFHINNY